MEATIRKSAIPCIVFKTFPQISNVFGNGDKVNCIPLVLANDVTDKEAYSYPVDADGRALPYKLEKIDGTFKPVRDYTNYAKDVHVPAVVRKAGTFVDMIIVAANGEEYSIKSIINMIGYVDTGNWLKKINLEVSVN